ncbi:hypothetical protein KW797_02475 [Candidatus Parcubacteria bacterium]|nr:hypothetical protein [Candidatus Parcubacteria bacterium]
MSRQDDAIEGKLDQLADAGFDAAASSFGGFDNPDIFIDSKPPVDIVQFVEDPLFLGSVVHAEPRVLELLWLIEQPGVREAFVQVGKGSGKSFVGAITPTYGAYLILSMRRPHLFFGLTDDTEIASINVSVGLLQAKNVIFKQMKGLIARSPWFQRHTVAIPLAQQVSFQDRNVTLYCGHSNSTAFLGFATFRAVLDEANFMVNNVNRNVAAELHAALRGSCKTRFPGAYKLVAISSAATPGAWLHGEIEAIRRAGKEVPLSISGLRTESAAALSDPLDSTLGDLFDEVGDE